MRGMEITLRNLNDGTVEEVECSSLQVLGAQYYPVSPGFEEVNPLLLRFGRMVKEKGR